MSHLKILLVDDQTLMRDALETILNLEDDMEVIGTASNGLEGFEQACELQPDLVLMDIKMPIMNGIESTKRIKQHLPDTKVLILTTFDEEDYVVEGLANGAVGYLLKDIHGDKLVGSIRDAMSGQLMLPAPVAARLAARLHYLSSIGRDELDVDRLKKKGLEFTGREREIAALMAQGLNNRQIANALYVSEGTVKNYISVIYSKIGTNDRSKAVLMLKEVGLAQDHDES